MSARYRITCGDCGKVTEAKTQALAEYGQRRHSCDTHRERVARAERDAQRRAADGPRRDCRCKQADHEHGTYVAYVIDKCRCRKCRDANSAYVNHSTRMQAYGRWRPYVDAEPARLHVKELMANGLGLKRIAAKGNVPHGVLSKLVYGGPGNRPPSRRIRPETERALLAVLPSLNLLGATVCVDGTGTRRRLQALIAIGYSQARLAAELGMSPANFGKTMRSDNVHAATARAVRELYGQMWDQPAVADGHYSRISVNRARNYADARGWVPGAAWDNIDDPAETPHVGDDTESRAAALVEDFDWLVSQGVSEELAAKQLGVRPASVARARVRLLKEAS